MATQASAEHEARAELAARLYERREELEQAIATRIHAIADPREVADPGYLQGLRSTVSVAIRYGIAVIELGEDRSPPPPPDLLAQARIAARAGVGLDTVLRRYFAGHAMLGDFVVEEVQKAGMAHCMRLQRLHRGQAAAFDQLLAAVAQEHGRESEERGGGWDGRMLERVRRLLAGELLDTSSLGYELTGWHLGAVAKGPDGETALRALAAELDRLLLCVRSDAETVWAWLGGRRQPTAHEIARIEKTTLPADVAIAFGEPGDGAGGWRLTHRQARAALSCALRSERPVARYSHVALIASVICDDLLLASLRKLYLDPLEQERDGGEIARRTLRAWFAANRNLSSAAVPLGVSRHTVASRLRKIETVVGRPLDECATEIETILRIEELNV